LLAGELVHLALRYSNLVSKPPMLGGKGVQFSEDREAFAARGEPIQPRIQALQVKEAELDCGVGVHVSP
jgi:hypothetical protein